MKLLTPIISCAASLAVLLTMHPNTAHAQAVQRRTIVVVGSAEEGATQSGSASSAHGLTFRIATHDVSATLAFAKLSDEIRSVSKTLEDEGASSSDISQGDVQMSPSYDYSKAGMTPAITGYQVSKPLSVRVQHEADLPKYIDAVTKSGIASVSLTNGNAEESTNDNSSLEHAALDDAHERAERLASEIGAKLGDVVSVSTVESESASAGGGEEREERERAQSSAPKKKACELRVVYSIH